MSIKQLVGSVLDTIVKIAVIAVVVTYTYRYAVQAFDFGYRIFAEPAVSSAETARAISISVTEGATVMDIGEVLEEKGMINDARLFYAQELLLGFHNKLKPGIYELSSDMTPRDMLEVMSAESADTEADGQADAAAEGGPAEGEGAQEGEPAEGDADVGAGEADAGDGDAAPEGEEAGAE